MEQHECSHCHAWFDEPEVWWGRCPYCGEPLTPSGPPPKSVDGIDLIPVESSNIAGIGHDPARRIIAIEFNSGAIFCYLNVDSGLFERLEAADSKGSFFYHHIKGRFKAEKKTGPCANCGIQGIIGERCTDCGTATHIPMAEHLGLTTPGVR